MANFGIDFNDESSIYNEKISPLIERLRNEGVEPGILTTDIFLDTKINDSFLSKLSTEEQYQYLKNTSKFESKLKKDRWLNASGSSETLFGPEDTAPEVIKQNGDLRRAETEKTINITNIRESDIDPSKVLIFRTTQLSDESKAELYWTSDYFQTLRGLSVEMGKTKESAVVLVSNLEEICNGGAIMDTNDDNGLAIRRISSAPFDQKVVLAIILPKPEQD